MESDKSYRKLQEGTMKILNCRSCEGQPKIVTEAIVKLVGISTLYAVECRCGWRSSWHLTEAATVEEWNSYLGLKHSLGERYGDG